MASHYELHPAALGEAADRNAFTDRLLEGTRLRDFLSSDPENRQQHQAKADLMLVLDRAWEAAKAAQAAAWATGGLAHA